MKKLFIIVATVVSLAACSNSTQSKICKNESVGYNDSIELNYQGSKIESVTLKYTVDLAITNTSKEEVDSYYESIALANKDTKGMTITNESKDNLSTIIIKLDYSKVESATLSSIGLASTDSNGKQSILNLEDAISSIKDSGYICDLK